MTLSAAMANALGQPAMAGQTVPRQATMAFKWLYGWRVQKRKKLNYVFFKSSERFI